MLSTESDFVENACLGIEHCSLEVIHTIASTSVNHGGTSRSVPDLCQALAKAGAGVCLITGRQPNGIFNFITPGPEVRLRTVPEYRHFGFRGAKVALRRELSRQVDRADPGGVLVHDHGIWLPANHEVASAARRHGAIRIVSPRGMLTRWALQNGWLKKRVAWLVYQRRDLAAATAFHATSEEEARDIRRLGFRQPIAVIPNGISLPREMPPRLPQKEGRQVLFLSRIHPVKGLLNLIQAWKLADVSPSWELVIAGPGDECHRREVEHLAQKLKVDGRIRFLGPVSHDEKWQVYRDADLFILPSFSENFGLVVAEAMAAGLPVITTTGTPWRELQENSLGWWVEPNVESITAALKEATALGDAQRMEMGTRAADWVKDRYAWNSIGQEMLVFYRWLLNSGERPNCVRTRSRRTPAAAALRGKS